MFAALAVSEYNLLIKSGWISAKDGDTVAFWNEVMEDDASNGILTRFQNITEFAKAALSIPASHASVERAFSILNLLKSKLRNRLQVATTEVLLTTRFLLSWKQQTCVTFEMTTDMLKKFNCKMYEMENDREIILEDDDGSVEASSNVQYVFETIENDLEVISIL